MGRAEVPEPPALDWLGRRQEAWLDRRPLMRSATGRREEEDLEESAAVSFVFSPSQGIRVADAPPTETRSPSADYPAVIGVATIRCDHMLNRARPQLSVSVIGGYAGRVEVQQKVELLRFRSPKCAVSME